MALTQFEVLMENIVRNNDLYELLRGGTISDIQLVTLAVLEHDRQHSVSDEVAAEIEKRKLWVALNRTIDPRSKNTEKYNG